MDALLAWAIANPGISVPIIAGAADIVAGWLPDRFTKWPGLILAGANKAYNFGKEAVETVEEIKATPAEIKPDDVAKLYQALASYHKALRGKK